MKNTKLYNMILPPFMLFAFLPTLWIISLVGNFIIDSLVLIIVSVIIYKTVNWKLYKKSVLLVWLFGFIADFVGVVYLILMGFLLPAKYYGGNDDLAKQFLSGIYLAVSHSTYDSIWGVLFIVSGIFVSAVFIFIFDYFFAFNNTELSKKQKIYAALAFAIFTAPYAFLLPKELFY